MKSSIRVAAFCLCAFLCAGLSAQTPPTITTQPASQVVSSGATVTFAVAAVGADSYQWFKDAQPLADATSASYVVASAAASDAGAYRVRVGHGGSAPVFSSAAVLMVGSPASTQVAEDFGGTAPSSLWTTGVFGFFGAGGTEFATLNRLQFSTTRTPGAMVDRCLESTTSLPLDRDWSVVVRLGLGANAQFPDASGAGLRRKAGLSLGVVSSTNEANSFDIGCRVINAAGTLQREVFSDIDFGDHRIPTGIPLADTQESLLVRIDYHATTGFLVSSREEAGHFVAVSTVDALQTWGMDRSQTLRLGLRGFSTRTGVPAGAVWADDFVALIQPAGLPLSGQTTGAAAAAGEVVKLALTTIVFEWEWFTAYTDGVALQPVLFATSVALPVNRTVAAETPPSDGYLSNLSVRAAIAPGQNFIVGFVVDGGAKPVLVRAADLGPFLDIGGAADPRLTLSGGYADDDWDSALAPTFAQLGAFPFAAASKDAALLQTIVGPQTALVTTSRPGLVLVEIYDAGPNDVRRLTNLSTRFHVGTGGDVLIAGFVLGGTGARQVLVRAVGPALAAQGVTGALADPQLHLFDHADLLGANDDWGGTPALKDAFAATGASPFASDAGKDAALLVTLQPGVYTAQVSGVNGTTGEALVELYLVP